MALLSKSRSKVAYDSPLHIRFLSGWTQAWSGDNHWGIGGRDVLKALGPGFLVSVGYMDPGNWGTNLAAGAGFGYQLLWVILVSNIVAIFLQIAAAKLGIATGKNLAQLIHEQFSRPVASFLGATAVIAIMATDLAEILGGALGFNILFGIPLFPAALLTGIIVMVLLGLSHWGLRKIEYVIMGFVSIIGLAYVYETALIHASWGSIAFHTVIPQISSGSILVAVGIIGATVMPHNIFLHSYLSPHRLSSPDAPMQERRKVLRLAKIDTIAALNVAFFVNAAMLVVAGAVFYGHVRANNLDLQTAYITLIPILGSLAGFAFGIGLLASGLSSTMTGTLAGQVVLEGFLQRRVPMWIWRVITLIPALLVAALNIPTVQVLVVSQVVLSLQLPFTIVALLILSNRRDLLGDFVNTRRLTSIHVIIALIIIALNVWLLYSTFRGQ
ncbi:Nramp family divalent metal transporter [Dictyobacter arantiisoli]|uniref:Divalent metal cation transporter MntH n=1 Tax=Dictyobacter arantiisoli TaxID=2014874 RepID=A0A5A5TD21_9CHLR|nr:Nramp family divalent metal transporter [Dictyobacter arantiisoli]GCF08824.1 divalent metal cation transporter MntH [Dictyobacter arantiisoli]